MYTVSPVVSFPLSLVYNVIYYLYISYRIIWRHNIIQHLITNVTSTSGNIQSHHKFYTLSLLGLIVVVVSFGTFVACCKKWISHNRSRNTTTVPSTYEEPVYETISVAMDEVHNKECKDMYNFTLSENDAYTVLHSGSTAHNQVNNMAWFAWFTKYIMFPTKTVVISLKFPIMNHRHTYHCNNSKLASGCFLYIRTKTKHNVVYTIRFCVSFAQLRE